jgi:hypothetical protein
MAETRCAPIRVWLELIRGKYVGFVQRLLVTAPPAQSAYSAVVSVKAPADEAGMRTPERFVLTSAQWAKMEPRCLGKPTDPLRSGSDIRYLIFPNLGERRSGSPRGGYPRSDRTASNPRMIPPSSQLR